MNEFIAHRHRNRSKKGRYFISKNTYLDYHWIPAQSWTPHSYTLVYFLGYNGALPQNLVQNDSHNLLCIVDRSGPQSRGSWYFGSQGPNEVAEDGDTDQPSRQMKMNDGRDEQDVTGGGKEVSILENP